MNTRLAEFLISLVRDPARLSAFNDVDYGREAILRDADLPEEDKEALRSDDATEVLRRLQATDEDGLSWVLAPGVKKFTVGVTLSGAPGVKAMSAPGVKATTMSAPGVKATMSAPGVKATMSAPGVKATMNAPGIKAFRAPRAGAGGSKKSGGGAARPAKRGSAGSSAKRKSASKSRR
jgi:hypothetical protein